MIINYSIDYYKQPNAEEPSSNISIFEVFMSVCGLDALCT